MQVGNKPPQVQMVPTNVKFDSWETFNEDVSLVDDESMVITAIGLLEQLNITRDTSDYLWYTTRSDLSDCNLKFYVNQYYPSLSVLCFQCSYKSI